MFFIVKCHPYGHDVLFALNETDDTTARYLRQALHVHADTVADLRKLWVGKHGPKTATTWQLSDGQQIIRYDDKVTGYRSMSLIVHEVVHAASFVLRRCGIEHTNETEEAYTYLIQHITSEAFKAIGKQWWK